MAIASAGEIGTRTNVGKGAALVAAAVLVFALGDVATKHLTMLYAVVTIIGFRYVVNLAMLAAALGPSQGSALWRTKRTGLVLLRSACLAISSLSIGFALQTLPVGETIAIVYLAPFVVMLLAGPLLGERVGLGSWMGAGVGFAGVLLILRPGGGLDPVGVAWAGVVAVAGVAFHLLTRSLARTETTAALLFNAALVGSIGFVVLVVFLGVGPLPTLSDFAILVALGFCTTFGHFLFASAYREAPASTLAPVNYVHLVWAALLGWVVFGHVPDAPTAVGIGLVIVAGAATAVRGRAG